MQIKWNGPEAHNFEVAELREGNAVLKSGDSFEVPQNVGKNLLASSAFFSESKKSKGDE